MGVVRAGLGLLGRQLCGGFGAEAVQFALLLQMDDGGIAVLQADAELLARVDAVELFAQRLVAEIVEI